ncbi:MAG: urate hydroxylase PuuD [Pseudomonadota bacterium]
MDGVWLDWLAFVLRFAHVVTAIAWIGASFYFIWLDLSLETPSVEKSARGLGGELWSIHGGGIYEVGKYRLAPPAMPTTLHWFKWEAYSTWLTGSGLLIALYYLRAQSYLVDPNGWVTTPGAAVAASVAYLLSGLAIYETLFRARLRPEGYAALAALMLLIAAASYVAFGLFSARAAIVHVGALLATIMAANVFLGIIPSQRALVAAIEAGTEPDAERALGAKLRSTHNNYFTLPVLFCMLAGHAPFVFGHPHAWLLVVLISLAAVVARHFFNRKHAGHRQPMFLVGAAAIFVAVAFGATVVTSTNEAAAPAEDEVARLVARHCTGCHAAQPTQPGFAAPPGGYIFLAPADLATHAALVTTSLTSGYMPLGNMTGMTAEERAALVAWVQAN